MQKPIEIIEQPYYWKKGNIYKYDFLPSSNTFLSENLDFFNDYDIVWVMNQWAGRGKYLAKWYGHKEESLTFSLLIPNIDDAFSVFSLTQLVALFISQTFDDLGINNNSIKFPNDVLVNHKKISGILIEEKKKKKKYFIVGIGINFNFKKKNNEKIFSNFTSLLDYSMKLSLDEFFILILENCCLYLNIWKTTKFSSLKDKWKIKTNFFDNYDRILLKYSKFKINQPIISLEISDSGDIIVVLKNKKLILPL